MPEAGTLTLYVAGSCTPRDCLAVVVSQVVWRLWSLAFAAAARALP
jgi:hypothetical protein